MYFSENKMLDDINRSFFRECFPDRNYLNGDGGSLIVPSIAYIRNIARKSLTLSPKEYFVSICIAT